MTSSTMQFDGNMEFDLASHGRSLPNLGLSLDEQLAGFCEFGEATRRVETRAVSFQGDPICVPTFINEFWTAKQRAASSLHEVSYRACFKPQLPRFFIERLTKPGDARFRPWPGYLDGLGVRKFRTKRLLKIFKEQKGTPQVFACGVQRPAFKKQAYFEPRPARESKEIKGN